MKGTALRYLPIVLLTVLSLFMLCSCAGTDEKISDDIINSISDPISDANTFAGAGDDEKLPDDIIDPIADPVPDVHTFYLQYNEENAKAWEQSDKGEWQTFTEDFDGLVITVTTDKSEYSLGDPIKVKATLQNKTDRDIYLVYSNSNNPCVPRPALRLLSLQRNCAKSHGYSANTCRYDKFENKTLWDSFCMN